MLEIAAGIVVVVIVAGIYVVRKMIKIYGGGR